MNLDNFFIAEVIDNEDSLKEGRVKISVEHLMSDFNESDLPWARPLTNSFGGSNDHGVLRVPKKSSFVWVFCEKPELYHNWFYIGDVSLKKMNPFKKILTFLSGKFKSPPVSGGLGLSSSYPNIDITSYPNGIYIGVSTDEASPEVFVFHPSALISIDTQGNLSSKATKWTHFGDIVVKEGNIEISEGDVEITKGKLEISEGDVAVTKGKLDVGKDIKWNTQTSATTASSHTHPTAVPGAPSPPTPGS